MKLDRYVRLCGGCYVQNTSNTVRILWESELLLKNGKLRANSWDATLAARYWGNRQIL